jgi:phosphopantetheine--protein transferase-like protein
MKTHLPIDVNIPVLYINPPLNADPSLIEAVSRSGGLGIVDHVTAGPSDLQIAEGVRHGVRVRLQDAKSFPIRSHVTLMVLPLEEADGLASLAPAALKEIPVPVFAEVGRTDHAVHAEKAGAAGLIAKGYEAPGWISETCGFVLFQEIAAASSLPIFLQGGIGLHTAAGAVAAGAAGVVLDVHLYLTEDSALKPSLKDFLQGLGFPATVTLAEHTGKPLRVYSRVGTKIVRELKKAEESLKPEDIPAYHARLAQLLASPLSAPDADDALLPLSEDIRTARVLAQEFKTASAVVSAFGRHMATAASYWPFEQGSPLCRKHGTLLPFVQGPMAHVSDNPAFLAEVVNHGALPFLAMGNMPAGIAKEAAARAWESTGGKFGVGLIGLEANRKTYEAHLDIMRKQPPPFAILAAGGVELAKRIEEIGTACYLHCPAPSMLTEGLKAGLRHFVFEGCESGGHIGLLGSLDLWNANLTELESAGKNGIPLAEVSVLMAGGIGTGRAAAFVAGMVGDLAQRGLNVGLQMGTAYLTTEEAVSTCAITSTYRELTLDSQRTVVIGRTVNIKARAAGSPAASNLFEREHQRLRDGLPLPERKELFEKDNLGALRLASKGCAIDPQTATWDCPVFCDLEPEEQLNRGLYLMGQVVSVLKEPRPMDELHAAILEGGKAIFQEASSAVSEPIVMHEEQVKEPDVELELVKEPIAVVGIGLLLPGAQSPAEYWDNIISGRNGIVDVPPDRWGNPDLYYDPDPKVPDKTYSRIGGFVTGFEFSPLKYRIPPSVARKMDRTQQMAVTCVAEAIQDAGLTPEQLKGRRVGIVLGNSMGGATVDRHAERVGFPRAVACLEDAFGALGVDTDTRAKLIEDFRSRYLADLPEITEDSLPGELANVISGRVANVFNLEGPNFTVDAACASSIAAVMNAVAALRDGRIDCALSGGVDAAMHPSSYVKFCKVGALSADGSRSFDEGANGFVMGEGAGVMVLKRLSDAIRDEDRIYATILEIGSSSDGRGKGITAPNAAGQERAIRACLEQGNIDPTTIGLVEAHGTSTPVGDKTELTVLDRLFREAGVPSGTIGIGSVKSQIGHLKAAAGAAGMIKAVLSLHHCMLPPTINVRRPNPCIEWESSPLFLVTEGRPWDTANGNVRRAAVSAFGFGGTNFHMVFQEHVPGLRLIEGKKQAVAQIAFTAPDWPKPAALSVHGEAWVIGADDPADVARKVQQVLVQLNPASATELAVRLRKEASQFPVRCGFAAVDADMAAKKLELIRDAIEDPAKRKVFPAKGIHVAQGPAQKAKAGVAFLFPGQGSQYPFMLRDLADRYPIVAQTLAEADEILSSLGVPSVTSCMFPSGVEAADASSDAADSMKDTQLLQPMILAANTAIFRLLGSMGIRPAATAGHSLGEYAACVAAGVFSFRDALEAVAVRGREMARVSIADPGLMMSIAADARLVEEVLAEVDGYVVAANKNSPKQTVISGETAAVKKAGELFRERGLEGVILPVSAAFHSGVVAPAREPFMRTLERLTTNPPLVPILSNVTGDFYPIGPAASDRIRDLLGKQFAAPVEWVKTLRRLHSEGIRLFVECGPKRVLTNLTLDTLPQGEVVALPTNHPKKGGILQFMETLAALAAEGVPVDFDGAVPAQTTWEIAPPRRPELRVVRETRSEPAPREKEPQVKILPNPLDALLDGEVRDIATQKEFGRFLELQGEPIRALIKSGYQTFVTHVLPLDKTARKVKSEGMDFQPVVVTGLSAGLPSDVRFPFDKDTLDDLVFGKNFIKKVSETSRSDMLEKNIQRVFKGPSGEAELRVVDDLSSVIQLAGYFGDDDIMSDYGLDERMVRAMDVTARLAVAAGIEALKDAGIPLVRLTRTTTTGAELPDTWALPPSLRHDTGIIFASAFPGMASLVDEVSRETAARYGAGAKKRLIEFYTGLVQRIGDDREREKITSWFTREFSSLNPTESEGLYTFNRDFLMKVMSLASGQMAQLIKAHGPNTHLDAACATTTQAMVLARDWIRAGQAKRVIVIAADDVAGKTLFPWVGSGFLAMGAATTTGNLSEAALPFDDRRHGLILGSAAVGVVVESEDQSRKRGVEPIATIEAGMVANSGFHGTRLDVDHISSVMQRMIGRWEEQTGRTRDDLAKDMFFMSHETYSPKRGGSSAAEVRALRDTFGDKVRLIPIANTKGLTGHTMGVGVEDAVALRCLQKRMLPPIPNLRQPDPDFADLNLSKGGPCDAKYALRLAAGFGSQIVMALYKAVSREENRIVDLRTHRSWLQEVTGYQDPVISVENRTLKVINRQGKETSEPARIAAQAGAPVQQKVAVRETVPVQAAVQAPVQPAVVAGQNVEEVRQKILSLLSDKTGYPADMLDTGLDLEADLGIDTVKQAEFITEVRDAFDIPRIDGLKIADFPTIEHIIGFVMSHVDSSSGSEPVAEAGGPATEDEGQVKEKILALLSDKTGYPADMLDTGLDLEADLGIDTVKQAEFITEVREAFGIPRIEGLKIADFPTIDHIIGFVLERSRDAAAPQVQAEAPQQAPEMSAAVQQEVGLFEARLVTLPDLQTAPLPSADEVIVYGGPSALSQEVEHVLRTMGYASVTRHVEPTAPDGGTDRRVGIVNLYPLDTSSLALTHTLELYVSCAKSFEHGPVFLVTAVSEDGALGFENPTEHCHVAGTVCGATKAFAREYPETRTRVIDLSPALSAQEFAGTIGRCLSTDFPLETAVGADRQLRAVRCVPAADSEADDGLHQGDVVLVTGGARGITAECMRALAQRRPLTFVILGRTAVSGRAEQLHDFDAHQWDEEKKRIVERIKRDGKAPTPVMVEKELSRLQGEAEAYRTIKDLKALGSEVMYRSVDVRDAESVDRAIASVAETCGRVDLVVHAAGVDVSRALRSKTAEQMEDLISVKIQGMLNLLQSLDRHDLPPRRIVGFGSVSGRFGNMAQVDYAAANDGLAHLLRKADRDLEAKASIIDWAPWSEIGMATRGSVQQTLESAGIDFIPPDKGAELFLAELGRTSSSPEVLGAGRIGPFTDDAFGVPGVASGQAATLAGQRGEIVTLLPGEYVRVRVFLDPHHPVLDDHRIERAAVFPGVGGMETMRAAATIMDPEAVHAVYEDVKFVGPIKVFKDEPFEVEVEVRRIGSSTDGTRAYFARILSWFKDKEGRKLGAVRLHHQCRLVVGQDVPAPQKKDYEPWQKSVWVSKQDIYEAFFHGPAFMYLDYVLFEGSGNGIRFGFVNTVQTADMFVDLLPAVVEAVFQTVAAYGLEMRGIMALPTRTGSVVVHDWDAVPYDGELLPAEAITRDGTIDRTVLRFNGTVRDAQGRVIMSLQGVEMMEFGPLPGFPRRIFQEMTPVAEVTRKLEAAPKEFLTEHFAEEEVQEHAAKKTPKRAREWLAGRLALKNCVQRLVANGEQAAPLTRSIRIVQDELGKPIAELTDNPGTTIGDISLSHSNGLAMAVASASGSFVGLGIDVEKVEERSDSWAHDYFTEDEIRVADESGNRMLALTGMWSLKEAFLKALGTGLRFDLKEVRVAAVDDMGRATLELGTEARQHLETHAPGSIEARLERQDNVVIAKVMIRKD